VAPEEHERPTQEADRGGCLLVAQHLGVGQPAGVVDRDVDELPAGGLAAVAVAVGEGALVVAAQTIADALARPALDPAELLDVDVHELPRPCALVAAGGLEPQPAELAEPDPGQDPRHGGERHPEQLGDLRSAKAQPAQGRDRLNAPVGGAVGHPPGRRGAVAQAGLAL
jgi:hypothetical protein